MDNNKKLELTLCGMLPYELKVNAPFLGTTDRSITTLRPIAVSQLLSGERSITPLLHSLDKLTEPILEGGLIPIMELEKEYSGFYFAFTNNQLLVKRKNTNMYFDVNHIGEILEKLKEWHFNIYDLPKEMYIEKSESNGK